MSSSIRIKRLEKLALQRASEVVLYELSDPRMALVTLTRVKLTNDLSYLTVYWSVLGTEGEKSSTGHALRQATGHVQREVAKAFQTRRSPRIRWEFDESIEGALRVDRLLGELRTEREAREVVYKIVTTGEWEAAQAGGAFKGSPVDLSDGYIHLSGADQVAETAAKHFAGQDGLVLLEIPVAALPSDALKWEPSRNDELFPHLYADLPVEAVAKSEPLPLGPDGTHALPAPDDPAGSTSSSE